MVTWYVIASRAGARIVQQVGREPVTLFEEIEHARGRLKDGELDTDKPGSAFESHGPGVRSMGKSEVAHEHVANEFAHRLAEGLRAARNDGSFGSLVLVAEPHFLGLLRGALDKPTAALVDGTINHDLTHVPMHAMDAELRRRTS